MLITTLANVKDLIGKTGTEDDTILNAIVLAVSARFENYCDRLIESKSRTEYFDIEEGQQLFKVKAFPVSALVCYNDETWLFTTALDTDVFTFLGDWGELMFTDYVLIAGPKALKVVYTGGMAGTQAALQTAYPDFEMAARIQAAFMWERRKKIGVNAEAIQGTSVQISQKLELISEVKETLDQYRRENFI